MNRYGRTYTVKWLKIVFKYKTEYGPNGVSHWAVAYFTLKSFEKPLRIFKQRR